MPVIECACGMVMSVPAATSRDCCIRCGASKLRLLKDNAASRATVSRIEPRDLYEHRLRVSPAARANGWLAMASLSDEDSVK
jgi:hypothetical protein